MLKDFMRKNILSNIKFDHIYTAFFGMMGAMSILIISHFISVPPKKMATIDINTVVAEFAKMESKKKVSPEKIEFETKQFGHELEKNIKQFATQNNFIIVPKEAVYAGAQDVTKNFIKNINDTGE